MHSFEYWELIVIYMVNQASGRNWKRKYNPEVNALDCILLILVEGLRLKFDAEGWQLGVGKDDNKAEKQYLHILSEFNCKLYTKLL